MTIYHFPDNTALLVTSLFARPQFMPSIDSYVGFDLFQSNGQPTERVSNVFRFANDCHNGPILARSRLSRPDLFDQIGSTNPIFGGHFTPC